MPSLTTLVSEGVDVAAVVTAPDRPAGRGLKPRPSPVKEAALQAGLEVLQPTAVRAIGDVLAGLDAGVVVAFGKIFPPDVLAIPRLGFVNLHLSVLPAYRGAAPVQWAIMNGERTTGISVMVLTEGMDEGPVLATRPEPIRADDSAGSLGMRLAEVGAGVLVDSLEGYAAGRLRPVEQDHSRATYAPKITSEQAHIDWRLGRARVADHVRALDPAPGAWTMLDGRRLRIFLLRAATGSALAPGRVAIEQGRLMVGAGDGTVEVVEAQLAGKRRMTGPELARGLRLAPDARLK